MNEKLKNDLDEFIKLFFDNPTVIRFLELKKMILESSELNMLETEIKKWQKKTALAINDEKNYQINRQKYLELKKSYDENPLIVNFNLEREEVMLLLEKLQQALK